MKFKVIKVLAITILVTFLVCLIGTAIAIGERTASYINRQNFDLKTALQWAIDDYKNWTENLFGQKGDNEKILEFEFANRHIVVEACTSH